MKSYDELNKSENINWFYMFPDVCFKWVQNAIGIFLDFPLGGFF